METNHPTGSASTDVPPRAGASSVKGVVARLIVGLAIVAGIWFATWRYQLRSSVKNQVAAIKAKGQPISWEDLEHWPCDVPDSENVALTFSAAYKTIDEHEWEPISQLFQRVFAEVSVSETDRWAMASLVQSNATAMEMVWNATNTPHARYPVNYLDGPNVKLTHLSGLKTLAQLFAFDALLKAEAHDSAGAVRSIESVLNLSRSLDDEPILISQLVSATILNIASSTFRRVLSRTTVPADQLSELTDPFAAAEATSRFVTGLVGERATMGEYMRLLTDDPRRAIAISNEGVKADEENQMPSWNPSLPMRFIGFFERDRDFFLRAMGTNIAFMALTPPASLAGREEMEKAAVCAQKNFYMMSSMLLLAMCPMNRDAETRARLRMALAAIEIEKWRMAHGGAVPKSLEEVKVGSVRTTYTDPFNGKEIRFKPLPAGYMLYSVGPNLIDDGGKEKPTKWVPMEERNNYDLVFPVDR
jgi:hypothetical protein